MFLFRPSNNNQRYAFVPLLDQSDNDDPFDDEDEDKGGKQNQVSSYSKKISTHLHHITFREVQLAYDHQIEEYIQYAFLTFSLNHVELCEEK